jgi:hypothetical protein
MSVFRDDLRRRNRFERRSALAGSVLIHLLLLAWFMNASMQPAEPPRDEALRTYDLPVVLPEIAEPSKTPALPSAAKTSSPAAVGAEARRPKL